MSLGHSTGPALQYITALHMMSIGRFNKSACFVRCVFTPLSSENLASARIAPQVLLYAIFFSANSKRPATSGPMAEFQGYSCPRSYEVGTGQHSGVLSILSQLAPMPEQPALPPVRAPAEPAAAPQGLSSKCRLSMWLRRFGFSAAEPILAEHGVQLLDDLRALGAEDLEAIGLGACAEALLRTLSECNGHAEAPSMSATADALTERVTAPSHSDPKRGSAAAHLAVLRHFDSIDERFSEATEKRVADASTAANVASEQARGLLLQHSHVAVAVVAVASLAIVAGLLAGSRRGG